MSDDELQALKNLVRSLPRPTQEELERLGLESLVEVFQGFNAVGVFDLGELSRLREEIGTTILTSDSTGTEYGIVMDWRASKSRERPAFDGLIVSIAGEELTPKQAWPVTLTKSKGGRIRVQSQR